MRFTAFVALASVLSTLFSFTSHAHTARFGSYEVNTELAPPQAPAPAPAQQAQPEEITVEKLMYSVVKINNKTANIFTAERSGGHGTGFFVGISPKTGKGLIFTNRHVIDAGPLDAQQLEIEFNTDDTRPETITGQLLFVSNLHDFAVIEFDPKELKRAHLEIPLQLPHPQSPYFDFVRNARTLRGRPVLAIGNPFDGSNITTYGQVTGLHFDDIKGPFIQTQTPINPGNSGGPLISLETGEVVGLNTMKLMGADNVGFATPIGPVMKEFSLWLEQRENKIRPNAGDMREMTFKSHAVSEGTLKLTGLYDQIDKAMPGYFNNYRTVLMVTDAYPNSGLQKDDILLTMDGEVIGGFPYNLLRRLQSSGVRAGMTVLRKGKVEHVEVSFPSASYHTLRQLVDYAYVSGLMFQELPRNAGGRIHPGMESGVVVGGLIPSAESNFMGMNFPPPGSVVAAVSFGGDDYQISSLRDLKNALNANRDKSYIQLRVYRSNLLQTPDGSVTPAVSGATMLPLVDGTLMTYVMPMREVLTPYQFSIHKFKKQFGFSPTDAATWNWREKIAQRLPVSCEELLSKKTPPQL